MTSLLDLSTKAVVTSAGCLVAGTALGLSLRALLGCRGKSSPDGEEYVPAKVWTIPEASGAWGHINQPTAGAREIKELPKGQHALQLYSLGTPNGQKVTCMLEELYDISGLEYDAWTINIGKGEQFGSEFVDINPNSKIPALKDYNGPDGKPINVFESASILLYLAEKTGHFIPKDAATRTLCLNWLFWIQGSAPYIGGGFGHFYKYAPKRWRYPIDRFSMEAKRILSVLENHLADGREYICGDEVTIADFCTFPWLRFPIFYGAEEFLQFSEYKRVNAYIERMLARPACQRGMRVNGFKEDAVKERHSIKDFE